MRNRWITFLLVSLVLLQPVAALSSVCMMSGVTGTDGLVSRELPPDINRAAPDIVDADRLQQDMRPACHEEPPASLPDPEHCKACSGTTVCATACSITTSILSIEYPVVAIAPYHAQFQHFTELLTPPLPIELYRPPKLS